MPTRLLRDWTDSLRFDGISADAERLFVRLLMKADDYGRFHSDPRLVRGACYPLAENLRTNDLSRWLDELSNRQLILRYEVGTRKLLAIPNFGQRLKMSRPKFPAINGMDVDWLPESGDFREVPGSSGKFRPDTDADTETDTHSETKTEAVLALPSAVSVWAIEQGAELPERLRTEPCLAAVKLWLQHKREKKDAYKPTGLKTTLTKWANEFTPDELPAAIENAIANSWKGVYRNHDSNHAGPRGQRPAQPHRNDTISESDEFRRQWALQPNESPGECPHPLD
jgi:hypothetical protein